MLPWRHHRPPHPPAHPFRKSIDHLEPGRKLEPFRHLERNVLRDVYDLRMNGRGLSNRYAGRHLEGNMFAGIVTFPDRPMAADCHTLGWILVTKRQRASETGELLFGGSISASVRKDTLPPLGAWQIGDIRGNRDPDLDVEERVRMAGRIVRPFIRGCVRQGLQVVLHIGTSDGETRKDLEVHGWNG